MNGKMTLGERIVKVETKLITIERLIYIVILALGVNAGIEFIPLA